MSEASPAWAEAYLGLSEDTDERARGHKGRAEFVFARDAQGSSFLSHQYAEYPFHVTRPFYLDAAWPELATLYLQSVSGGLFQGDRLRLKVRLEPGAAVHITSQSATKVHSMERGWAVQAVELDVAPGGYLEYLLDPTILFPHARLISTVALVCADEASAIVGDSFLTHDPAGGTRPAFDFFASEIAIRRPGGRLEALDRFCIERPGEDHGAPGLAGGNLAQGAVYLVSRRRPAGALAHALREALAGFPQVYAGASTLPGEVGAWLRILAPDGAALRAALEAAWATCRELASGKPMTARQK